MTDIRLTVGGHVFQTKQDYEAACRDKKKVDEIRRKVDLQQPQAVLSLLTDMEQGVYSFESVIGRDFDDEIFELAQKAKQSLKENPHGGSVSRKGLGSLSHKKKLSGGGESPAEQNEDEFQYEVRRELKKREIKRRATVVFLSVIAVCSLGYFIYYYYMADKSANQFAELSDLKGNEVLWGGQTEVKQQKAVLDEYKTLYNMNKSLIGYVKIDDTNIDYPVMRSSNQDYYLDRDFKGKKDKNGSIFMDTACDPAKPSDNLIIYGHNMKSGQMFGSLSKYEKEEYYKKHKLIRFDTIFEKGTYEVMYTFRSKVYLEEEIVFKYYQFIDADTEEEFNSNMHEMAQMSFYDTGVTAEFGDKLLTLSTCDYNEKNGRFVVVARKIS